MTTVPASATDQAAAQDLEGLGYQQELDRSIGVFASFATGFSFVSIVTTVFQLFAFGFAFAGPAFFWTWPIVFCGQLLVAAMFAELAARWPISGCIYQWSSRLGGQAWGWTAGWLMLVGQIVTLAGAAIALQAVLPSLWSGFQFVDGDAAVTSPTGAANAVILGIGLLVITTAINAAGVRLTAIINSTGVSIEIIGVLLLTALFLTHVERDPAVVLPIGESSTTAASFVVSSLMAAYVFVGFDSAAEMSEETHRPRQVIPRTILRAVVASGIGGAAMLICTIMAAPSLTDGRLATEGIAYVALAQLGEVLGRFLLLLVAIAVTVCTLAIQAATTRMFFSMARDGQLPFSRVLSRVSPRTRTPLLTSILVGAAAAAVLLVNVGDAGLFTTLASVCIMILYVAYLMVTVPLLVARVGGTLPAPEPGTFSLGRWGLPVNIAAVVFGIAMAINLAWPRAEIFDPAGEHPWMKYFGILFLLGALAIGALTYRFRPGVRSEAVLEVREDLTAPPHSTRH